MSEMKYYKIVDDGGIRQVGYGSAIPVGGVEVTPAEYELLLAELDYIEQQKEIVQESQWMGEVMDEVSKHGY